MEFLLIIGVIWLVIALFRNSSDHTPSNRTTYTPSSAQEKNDNRQTFRPSRHPSSGHNIIFTPGATNNSELLAPSDVELDGLHDAFTGAPLDRNSGLYQCRNCKVYYHAESIQILIEVNNSKCVSCQSTNIVALVVGDKTTRGGDYNPNVVTLQNYKQHVGSVVTFEGRVYRVNESRRGNDFAVMFENKSWVAGFKLVFFRGSVQKIGVNYINSLVDKTVKVRGLIVKHPTFGYEIIISEKSMILSVK
jgi:hypothetical protein